MCATKTHMMGRSGHVPASKTIELLCAFQEYLFPTIEEDLGPLGERYQLFITVLEFVRVEQHLPCFRTLRGRPQQDRAALARAFMAKAVFQIDTTRALLERLANDRALRCLCGWNSIRAIPSEATFSRAFAGFAEGALPSRLHEALIEHTMQEQLVGHVSRAATLPEMLDDLPHACDVGSKRNAKGYKESWIGYKLHIDAGDGGIPLSCILTSASVNDCQVAIPLATMTAARVTNRYDLMDAAYDAAEIRAFSESLGHVPIIDVNPRNNSAAFKQELKQEAKAKRTLGQPYAKDVRYRERSTVERVNGRLKDEFGARQVRVRGHSKVLCHLIFGILALTVDQLLRFVN